MAFPMFVTASLWGVFMMANRWFVADLADPETYGQFSFAATVLGVYAGIFGIIAQAYYPKLSAEAYVADPFDLSRRVADSALKLAAVISVLSAIGVMLAEILVSFIYAAYAAAVPAMKVFLVAGIPLISATWLIPIAMSARTRPTWEIVAVYFLAIGTLWAGTVIGYREVGLEGVGIGVIIASFVMLSGQSVLLRRSRVLSIRDSVSLILSVLLLSGSVALVSIYMAP
jgi:O-antigen/teichoic acid export membrane protein